ncbi:hypothetical protein [Microbaculum marinisediminis]|uniref:Uncharacterized protein n=1 Tax=Microbaculum marinisediminis TaxID=2931392 RepID=A0AAW5R1U6_9HYPH|nr:hypothetical protein [Microbaculum sp. A6E488]MCT8972515.1 hypothetical protein [Microbaculum sp. A6E488]
MTDDASPHTIDQRLKFTKRDGVVYQSLNSRLVAPVAIDAVSLRTGPRVASGMGEHP